MVVNGPIITKTDVVTKMRGYVTKSEFLQCYKHNLKICALSIYNLIAQALLQTLSVALFAVASIFSFLKFITCFFTNLNKKIKNKNLACAVIFTPFFGFFKFIDFTLGFCATIAAEQAFALRFQAADVSSNLDNNRLTPEPYDKILSSFKNAINLNSQKRNLEILKSSCSWFLINALFLIPKLLSAVLHFISQCIFLICGPMHAIYTKCHKLLNRYTLNSDNSALIRAVYADNILSIILNSIIITTSGEDINYVDLDGNTALHRAVLQNNQELVKCLINIGSNINIKNNNGETPLQMAQRNKNSADEKSKICLEYLTTADSIPHHPKVRAIERLIKLGENVNYQGLNGNTALHWAAFHNDLELIKCLIKNGADGTIKNKKGETPLQVAKRNNEIIANQSKECIALLSDNKEALKNDMESQAYSKWRNLGIIQKRLVQLGIIQEEKHKNEIARLIIYNDEFFEKHPFTPSTAIQWAAFHNDPELIKYLIKNGAYVNAKNNNGETPLQVAQRNSQNLANQSKECIALLSDSQKSRNMKNDHINRFLKSITVICMACIIGVLFIPAFIYKFFVGLMRAGLYVTDMLTGLYAADYFKYEKPPIELPRYDTPLDRCPAAYVRSGYTTSSLPPGSILVYGEDVNWKDRTVEIDDNGNEIERAITLIDHDNIKGGKRKHSNVWLGGKIINVNNIPLQPLKVFQQNQGSEVGAGLG